MPQIGYFFYYFLLATLRMKRQLAFSAVQLSSARPSIARYRLLPPIIHNSITSLLNKKGTNVQGYLVASTLSGDKLEDVGTFLKWNQILEMSVRRTLSNLIIWRQVFPPGSSSSSSSRSFIAVVGTVFNSSCYILYSHNLWKLWTDSLHYCRRLISTGSRSPCCLTGMWRSSRYNSAVRISFFYTLSLIPFTFLFPFFFRFLWIILYTF